MPEKTRLNQIRKAGTNGEAQGSRALKWRPRLYNRARHRDCIRASRSTPCRSVTDNDIRLSSKRRDELPRDYGVARHVIFDVDLSQFGGSALTDDIDVPKKRPAESMADEIPVTYVPARNTVFLSLALAWAETLGAQDVFIGVNALDYSGYPDCRPEYIQAFSQMADLATKAGVEGRQHLTIHTPLIHLSKAEIVKRGRELGVD